MTASGRILPLNPKPGSKNKGSGSSYSSTYLLKTRDSRASLVPYPLGTSHTGDKPNAATRLIKR